MSYQMNTTSGEGKSRKRLKPLLLKLLNEKSIPGMYWRDREQLIWQMPWKYHKQTRWGDPDALMLREVAKCMYNYQGSEEPPKEMLKKWKELLRNACTSLDDIVELRDLHMTDGDRPYKVYKFTQIEPESSRRERGRRTTRDATKRHDQAQASFLSCQNPSQDGSTPADLSNLHQIASTQTLSHDLFNLPLLGDLLGYVGEAQVLNQNILPTVDTQNVLWPNDENISPSTGQDSSVADCHNTLLEHLADNVDDDILSHLMSECNPYSFRSRSPLRQNDEGENYMNIRGSSINGVDEPSTKGTYRASTMTHLTPCLSEGTSHESSQPLINHNTFTCVTPQNLTPKTVNQEMNTSYHVDLPDFENLQFQAINSANPEASSKTSKEASFISDSALSELHSYCQDSHPGPLCQAKNGSYSRLQEILACAPAGSLVVAVYYNVDQLVTCQILKKTFRICFHASESIKTCTDPNQFGPTNVDLFELPEITTDTVLSSGRDTQKILNNLIRGVIIDIRQGNIVAKRYCKAVPYVNTPYRTSYTKINRHEEVTIFDVHDFLHSCDPKYKYQNKDPRVRLAFAVKDADKRVSPLNIDLWHTDVYHVMRQKLEGINSLEADCSVSDEYDRRLEIEDVIKSTVIDFSSLCS